MNSWDRGEIDLGLALDVVHLFKLAGSQRIFDLAHQTNLQFGLG